MKKFEYLEHIRDNRFGNSDFLNEFGESGWELVSVVSTNDFFLLYIFKREIIEKEMNHQMD
jgi:hypothetical protein